MSIVRIVPPLSFEVFKNVQHIQDILPTTLRSLGIKTFGFNSAENEYWLKTNKIQVNIKCFNIGAEYTKILLTLYIGTEYEMNKILRDLSNKLN